MFSIKDHKGYLAARNRLNSEQNKADRKRVSTYESGMKNIIRPELILTSNGVTFINAPTEIKSYITIDNKLHFQFKQLKAEVSWREPSMKPPKGAFVIGNIR
tara:strand:+ start:77 stop:382 length:306 start_codon:yes stop_codon:yes gene_type:complete